MSVTKIKSESDTTLNSNSSWSVLDDSFDSVHVSKSQKTSNEIESDIDVDENLKAENNPEDEVLVYLNANLDDTNNDSEQEKDEGFLTFDEFYQERVLDNGDESSSVKDSKTNIKPTENCKAELISILSLAASLLTITGLTLLMMMFPATVNKPDYNKVQTNYLDVYNNKNASLNDFHNLSNASETFNLLHETQLTKNITDSNKTNVEKGIFDKAYLLKVSDDPKLNTNKDKVDTRRCPNLRMKQRKYKTNSKNIDWFAGFTLTNSNNLKSLSDLLRNSNFHRVVCTLLQDICLIRLIYQLNKKFANNDKTIEKNTQSTQSTTKNSSAVSLKRKQSVTKIVISDSISKESFEKQFEDSINKMLKKSLKLKTYTSRLTLTPAKSKKNSLLKISQKNRTSSSNIKLKENGKSECERRFEDLEKQLNLIGITHRKSIQEIKDRFKEVMSNIHEDTTLKSRTEKIHETHDKYIQMLKKDQRKYLEEMQIFRKERLQIMNELCKRKSSALNSAKKDVSVGNCPVLLPNVYDFQETLKLMRDKENYNSNSNFNNSTSSSSKTKKAETEKFLSVINFTNSLKDTGSQVKLARMKHKEANATVINVTKKTQSNASVNCLKLAPSMPIYKVLDKPAEYNPKKTSATTINLTKKGESSHYAPTDWSKLKVFNFSDKHTEIDSNNKKTIDPKKRQSNVMLNTTQMLSYKEILKPIVECETEEFDLNYIINDTNGFR